MEENEFDEEVDRREVEQPNQRILVARPLDVQCPMEEIASF